MPERRQEKGSTHRSPPHHCLPLTTDTPNAPGSPHAQLSSCDGHVCAKHLKAGEEGRGSLSCTLGLLEHFLRTLRSQPRQPGLLGLSPSLSTLCSRDPSQFSTRPAPKPAERTI